MLTFSVTRRRVWPPSVKALRESTGHSAVLRDFNPAISRRLLDWLHLGAVLQQDQLKERTLVVDVLIVSTLFQIRQGPHPKGTHWHPVAVETLLSCVVCGETGRLPTGKLAFLLIKIEDIADAALRKIWEIQALGPAPEDDISAMDAEALKKLEETLIFDGERRHVMALERRLKGQSAKRLLHVSPAAVCRERWARKGIRSLPIETN
ncbi:hypothetical protein T4B_6875 [Trichinella pseudospiralis]|uniref:Uncharacterized protein n=1 Tax=Trichinella pseudospiralis TaxID=6337 RepID=A0A0V1IP95_TRIPS|nr:hypothetical protein T4A_6176 [Trichinella pseudospiralis]KRZ22953.1 hypothetical protein T4B_6875 [Trichinella pseudospiralis]KRZ24465.1 hypothetical protein T4C_9246 [Trichinella pseudospiralis]